MSENKNTKNTTSDAQQKVQSAKDQKQENKKTNTPANETNVYTK